MTETHPFIEQIDHVGIHTPQPRHIFDFLQETLGLPVAFPYTEYPGYHSGCVALGNCFLEIMRFGDAPANGNQSPRDEVQAARYLILGFLNGSQSLAETRNMLQPRKVRHSAAVPFFAPDATDENPEQLWANVYVGQLLGYNLWMRLFFFLSRNADPRPSDMESKALRAMFLGLMKRAFVRGMPVLTAYYSHLQEYRAAIGPDLLREREGGLAGVVSAAEVEVGAPDLDAWRRFLHPLQPNDRGRLALGEGPALRLLPHDVPGIRSLTLRVASLPEAEEALRAKGLELARDGEALSLTLPESGGLAIRFVG